MADKLADLSPEDKEKRIAEMKAKMQAAAAKSKTAGGEATTPAAAAAVKTASSAAVVTQAPPPAAPKVVEEAKTAAGNGSGAHSGSNGTANGAAAIAASPLLTAPPLVYVEETAEQKAKKEMNRREFLTYAWGATLGLLALQGGVGIFFFMYPRFKAGEFGGMFFIGPESALPATDAPPDPNTAGKFWLVNTVDDGPKALYMVCTHLGCLYKWEQSNNRFECPCHGSKFSREGFYIEGPAGRSLDTFVIAIENGEVSVDTGKKTLGGPAADSPARAVVA